MTSAKKHWSYSTGERGRNRVRAYEDHKTGIFLAEFYEGGKRKRVSLGHQDVEKAKQQADEMAAEFGKAPKARPVADITLQELFDNYLRERTPEKKSKEGRRHDRCCAVMFLRLFGVERKAKTLGRLDWDRFIRERREGRVGPSGRKVGNRAIERDLRWLRSVFNWAATARLVERNPVQGFPLPKESSPRRPVMTQERYEAMLAVAERIDWRFKLALVLAHETGHRIGAIRQLRRSDLDLPRHVVRWRAEADKIGFGHETPLTSKATDAVEEAQRRNPAIGDAWVFPASGDPSKPCSRYLMRGWWYRAERLADLQHVKGLGWHGLRRKFADELRDAPLRDLQALGGWKNPTTPLE